MPFDLGALFRRRPRPGRLFDPAPAADPAPPAPGTSAPSRDRLALARARAAEGATREALADRTRERDRALTEARARAAADREALAAFGAGLSAALSRVRDRLAACPPDREALARAAPDGPAGLDAQAAFLAATGLLEVPALGRDPLTVARRYLLGLDGDRRPAPYFHPGLHELLDPEPERDPGLDPFVRFLLRAPLGPTVLSDPAYRLALWRDPVAPQDGYRAERAALAALPHFDRDHYRTQVGPAELAGLDPVDHYLRLGRHQGRSPHPDFDPRAWEAAHPGADLAAASPFLGWLAARADPDRPRTGRPETQPDDLPPPRVSVIVPCYNHARYLPERLDSIYGQTFDDFEVILLDDASSDGSAAILERYAAVHPERTRLVRNRVNGGRVFAQWRAGLALARGELCWIAESDDRCGPDFLAGLVPAFDDPAVLLAHARCRFVDADGAPAGFTLDHYLAPVGARTWRASFVRPALAEVRGGLGARNTVPNISAAVFRNPAGLALLDDPHWLSLRICGDWLFTLHRLAGGRIAFRAEVESDFRLSAGSAGARTYADPAYYREHAAVAAAVARLYKVGPELLARHRRLVADFYAERFPDDALHLDRLYPPEAAAAGPRTPTVLVSLFAFSLGGGEIAPIRLANALRAAGVTVAVHSLDYLPPEPAVRGRLRPDIPVYAAKSPEAFADLVAELAPDVVNTHHHALQVLAAAARRRRPEAFAGAVHVASLHGMYEAMPGPALDAELPGLCRAAEYWTYVADKNLEPFKARGLHDPARFLRLPNGVEPPHRGRDVPTRPDLGLPGTALVLCLASRALPGKGWREAVGAVDLARELCGADIRLLLVGDGDLYDELLCLPLPDHVRLTGLVPDAGPYYDLCDLGLLPSRFAGESMPLTVLEALARGKPVLATAVGEVPQLLGPEPETAGALLPLRPYGVDVAELAGVIAGFATDPGRLARATAAARARAGRFDIAATARRFLELFCPAGGRGGADPVSRSERPA